MVIYWTNSVSWESKALNNGSDSWVVIKFSLVSDCQFIKWICNNFQFFVCHTFDIGCAASSYHKYFAFCILLLISFSVFEKNSSKYSFGIASFSFWGIESFSCCFSLSFKSVLFASCATAFCCSVCANLASHLIFEGGVNWTHSQINARCGKIFHCPSDIRYVFLWESYCK